MRYRFIDGHGFAGGFTLGAVQSGLQLVGKRETSPFGVANMEANRHLLGESWDTQIDANYDEWEAVPAHAVLGNPPCSGFSLMTHKEHRGVDAAVNACMKGLISFAARVPDVQIVVFESVQQAYTQGIELMRWLRVDLENRTHKKWDLYHVLHNGYSLGGSSVRRRYFWVASQVPFGIDPPRPTRVPTLWDVIGDLEGMDLTWEHQPYRRAAGWWPEEQMIRNGQATTDGHKNIVNRTVMRNFDLITDQNPWPIKATTSSVLRKYYELYGEFPESWRHLQEKMLAKRDPVTGDFRMGFIQPVRWHPDRAGRVITGSGMLTAIHPYENRMLTHREVARIMGFPDEWRIYPNRGLNQLAFNWGKGLLVQCGRWIGQWVQEALDGSPGGDRGELIGDRESVFNYTMNHRHLSNER